MVGLFLTAPATFMVWQRVVVEAVRVQFIGCPRPGPAGQNGLYMALLAEATEEIPKAG